VHEYLFKTECQVDVDPEFRMSHQKDAASAREFERILSAGTDMTRL